jgi:glycosyltransferase involved in cell wall biosynthesis
VLNDFSRRNKVKRKVHWLCTQPTPYNDFLFRSLASDPDIDLTVHYTYESLQHHPWRSTLGQGYQRRYYRCTAGIDWDLISTSLKEKEAFFIIGGWNHPTLIALISLLCQRRKPFALWTDAPNYCSFPGSRTHFSGRKRNPIFSFFRSNWLKWVFEHASYVMGTGSGALAVLQQMGCERSKLEVFPFFIDLRAYDSKKELSDLSCVRFISVGLLVSGKGHNIALHALAEAARTTGRTFEYLIAGIGPDYRKLRELAEDLGLGSQVKFLGWVEPDDLRQHFRRANILIHPSTIPDAFSVAVLEAMASSLVVLGSDVTVSVIDRIEHGTNGFIHPAGNVEVLAKQIASLLNDPQTMVEMSTRARKTAEQWPVERGVRIIKRIITN